MNQGEKNKLSDIHTHILPKFDDGSSKSSESLEMLRSLYEQGVGRVVATPHFYASKDEPRAFLSRRDEAESHLAKRLDQLLRINGSIANDGLPTLYIGAEVEFFNAMSFCPELDGMCIRGTKYLLVEMPFDKWTGAMLEELYRLKKKRGINPIIAHIDRYFRFFTPGMLDGMISNGILIQCNAEAFLKLGTRGRALQLLDSGKIHLLGSDCHNMQSRRPRVADACQVIEKRLGSSPIKRLCKTGEELLACAEPFWTYTEAKNDEIN